MIAEAKAQYRKPMELFQPNNLSVARPSLVAVDEPELLARISEIADEVFRLPNASEIRLAKFAGANVTSDNLAVTAGNDRWFLKRKKVNEKTSLERETNLALQLGKLGLKVPQVIETANGASCFVDNEAVWAFYKFEDGHYFTGKDQEIDSAALEFGKLTRVVNSAEVSATNINDDPTSRFLDDLENSLMKAQQRSNETIVSNLCHEHFSKIVDDIVRTRQANGRIESKGAIVHLDYHPLNLLIRDGEVACVLDLEHLKWFYALPGVGFAAYKLIRQTLVESYARNPATIRDLVDRWIAAVSLDDFGLALDSEALGTGARYRILFLIHLILDHSNRGDTRFNYDLEKQILSLYETDVIFG